MKFVSAPLYLCTTSASAAVDHEKQRGGAARQSNRYLTEIVC